VTFNIEKAYLLWDSNWWSGCQFYWCAFDAIPCQKHGHSGDHAGIAVTASVATLRMLWRVISVAWPREEPTHAPENSSVTWLLLSCECHWSCKLIGHLTINLRLNPHLKLSEHKNWWWVVSVLHSHSTNMLTSWNAQAFNYWQVGLWDLYDYRCTCLLDERKKCEVRIPQRLLNVWWRTAENLWYLHLLVVLIPCCAAKHTKGLHKILKTGTCGVHGDESGQKHSWHSRIFTWGSAHLINQSGMDGTPPRG